MSRDPAVDAACREAHRCGYYVPEPVMRRALDAAVMAMPQVTFQENPDPAHMPDTPALDWLRERAATLRRTR